MEQRPRHIIVPKDAKAEEAFDIDEATDDQLIILSITEEDISFLYDNEIFDLINEIGDVYVTEYDMEWLTKKRKIFHVMQALKVKLIEHPNSPLLQNLYNLFNEAFTRHTSIHFYL